MDSGFTASGGSIFNTVVDSFFRALACALPLCQGARPCTSTDVCLHVCAYGNTHIKVYGRCGHFQVHHCAASHHSWVPQRRHVLHANCTDLLPRQYLDRWMCAWHRHRLCILQSLAAVSPWPRTPPRGRRCTAALQPQESCAIGQHPGGASTAALCGSSLPRAASRPRRATHLSSPHTSLSQTQICNAGAHSRYFISCPQLSTTCHLRVTPLCSSPLRTQPCYVRDYRRSRNYPPLLSARRWRSKPCRSLLPCLLPLGRLLPFLWSRPLLAMVAAAAATAATIRFLLLLAAGRCRPFLPCFPWCRCCGRCCSVRSCTAAVPARTFCRTPLGAAAAAAAPAAAACSASLLRQYPRARCCLPCCCPALRGRVAVLPLVLLLPLPLVLLQQQESPPARCRLPVCCPALRGRVALGPLVDPVDAVQEALARQRAARLQCTRRSKNIANVRDFARTVV